MSSEKLWQTKLHARLHDPAEKALVLMRDPAGHEGGTSKVLHRLLGFDQITQADLDEQDPDNTEALHATVFKNGIPLAMYQQVKRADWWAAAADRPQWPMQEITITTRKGEQKTLKVADWAQVPFTKTPVLIHPLTGASFDLGEHGGLADTDVQDIKQRSFEHFAKLVVQNDGETDWQKTLLAFWRFGPELIEDEDFGTLGPLWRLLPADTRTPDHSIWEHLDLTSAFAGAFAADVDGEASLLALSIGPVQSFIEAARTTSDLWAGSHLLSRLAWEAMKPVCEAFGPDAILFPRLRGVPQVDAWLRADCGLKPEWFGTCDWTKQGTDANPLFAAALPNRFVAVVPRDQAKSIAEKVESTVRIWLQTLGESVVNRLLAEASLPADKSLPCYEQMRDQLRGFPEVHWAAVPFSLIHCRDKLKQRDLDTTALSAAMAPFFGVATGQPCGFLDSPAWRILQKETKWQDNTTFFVPNPGVLYPAIHDLAERVMAAAKATRRFEQTRQDGWRCSLTGETEWLTTDRAQLSIPPGSRTDTLWTRIAGKKKAWAKKDEHLGALPAIKRLWPTLFAEEVAKLTGGDVSRFVVSTHTMSLTGSLSEWLKKGELLSREFANELAAFDRVALPRKLVKHAYKHPQGATLARIPSWLDACRETDNESTIESARRKLGDMLGKKPETYYSLLMMDGDRMGAWLSGGADCAITHRDSFHPKVQSELDKRAANLPLLKQYAEQQRALSPNRHLAISGALNDFSLTLARHVVEEEHFGRLIYAGGDDVLAMVPVSGLLSTMQRLRLAYSGHDPEQNGDSQDGLLLQNGFAMLDGKLMRMMGEAATASIGAVVAHHQAPLGAVLRELRVAEKRAKQDVAKGGGGRNAFSLTVIKRSGGTLQLTDKWGLPASVFGKLVAFVSDQGVSRRAVYHCMEWLKDLPEQPPIEMLTALLAYQFDRQAQPEAKQRHDIPQLSKDLADLTLRKDSAASKASLIWLRNFLSIAEFLAREIRAGSGAKP